MTEYNPADYNIADVNAYLEKNPGEVQAVLAAEKARGADARSTLVSSLEEQAASVTQPTESAPVEGGLSETPAEPGEPTESKPVEVSPSPAPSFFGKNYEVSPDKGYRVKQS